MKPHPVILLTAIAALSILTACRQPEKDTGLTQVKLQADWYPQPEHGGFYNAIVKGYYRQEGLDVQILPRRTLHLERASRRERRGSVRDELFGSYP